MQENAALIGMHGQRTRSGNDTDFLQIRLREARTTQTSGEFWFPNALHESIFNWLEHKALLIVAGIAAPEVDPRKFEYDMRDSPLHFLQAGYYLCDRLWSRS